MSEGMDMRMINVNCSGNNIFVNMNNLIKLINNYKPLYRPIHKLRNN